MNLQVKSWPHLAGGTSNFTAGVSPPKRNALNTALETTFATWLFFLSIIPLLTSHQRLCWNFKALWNIGECYTVVTQIKTERIKISCVYVPSPLNGPSFIFTNVVQLRTVFVRPNCVLFFQQCPLSCQSIIASKKGIVLSSCHQRV